MPDLQLLENARKLVSRFGRSIRRVVQTRVGVTCSESEQDWTSFEGPHQSRFFILFTDLSASYVFLIAVQPLTRSRVQTSSARRRLQDISSRDQKKLALVIFVTELSKQVRRTQSLVLVAGYTSTCNRQELPGKDSEYTSEENDRLNGQCGYGLANSFDLDAALALFTATEGEPQVRTDSAVHQKPATIGSIHAGWFNCACAEGFCLGSAGGNVFQPRREPPDHNAAFFAFAVTRIRPGPRDVF
jgi:hypothetical protein